MKKEIRTAVFDDMLQIEAYRFEGVEQPFPNHFHDYYVIGTVESGERVMTCGNREYTLSDGDILLLAPSDAHGCVQTSGTLDYRAINISERVMGELSREITGESELPRFSANVIRDSEISEQFCKLHEMIMQGCGEFEKEEVLLSVISELIRISGMPFFEQISRNSAQIDRACEFMKEHFAEHITLEQLCECSGLSKSTLLRSFTRARGITPYKYLQAVRVGKAKELLKQGAKPIDAAFLTGFSNQSHFTNSFGTFIGLSPTAYRRAVLNGKDNQNE